MDNVQKSKNILNNKKDSSSFDKWVPVTKLGRLVKTNKISSIEQIFYFSLPIKEKGIVEFFLADKLKDEVLKICQSKNKLALVKELDSKPL